MLEKSQVLRERYQLKRKLRQNASRYTWLAVDLQSSSSELVIVKLLAFSPQMQWEDFKLFEREAQVLQHLAHPRIPRYRDYFCLDKEAGFGLCWFALIQDYIPGVSLQQLLEQGKGFNELEVRSIATQVLEILTYLHELHPPVLHRDIKPSNIIWTEDEQVYLVDFGAVQNQPALEGVTFTVVGTVGYAPLEQFWGRAVPASDLYSLGVSLIHLLTGVAPGDLPYKNLRIQFEDRVSISPDFVDWLEALTEPDVAKRYDNAKDAIADLKNNRSFNYPLQKVHQPYGSRIALYQFPTQLKLQITDSKKELLKNRIALGGKFLLAATSFISLIFVVGTILLIIFFGFLWAINASSTISIVGTLICLEILLALLIVINPLWQGIGNKLIKLISELKKIKLTTQNNYCLYFNEKEFWIERKLFGWSYIRQVGQIANIKNIKYVPSQGLIIQTQTMTYAFGRGLTKSECKLIMENLEKCRE